MRGKVFAIYLVVYQTGITPAHAGKSLLDNLEHHRGQDHPRACGEKYQPAGGCRHRRGSPPRMRGKAESHSPMLAHLGITPAHAGKSCRQTFRRVSGKDHPRACGEKYFMPRLPSCALGSPPRMRGKDVGVVRFQTWAGITPAHAGKRSFTNVFSSRKKDHPRACGEKGISAAWDGLKKGSPPRMRGKAAVCPPHHELPRITPAHAGKSAAHQLEGFHVRDHPRACGEKRLYVSLTATYTGSPPRMRGKD